MFPLHSALLPGLLLQHTLHTSVCFVGCKRSDPSVLAAGKWRSRTEMLVFIGLTSTCPLTTPTKSHPHKFNYVQGILRTAWGPLSEGTPGEDPGMSKGSSGQHGGLCLRGHEGRIPGCPRNPPDCLDTCRQQWTSLAVLQLSIHTSGEKDLLGLEIQLPIYKKNELWVYKHSNKFMDINFVFINTNFVFINTGSNL